MFGVLLAALQGCVWVGAEQHRLREGERPLDLDVTPVQSELFACGDRMLAFDVTVDPEFRGRSLQYALNVEGVEVASWERVVPDPGGPTRLEIILDASLWRDAQTVDDLVLTALEAEHGNQDEVGVPVRLHGAPTLSLGLAQLVTIDGATADLPTAAGALATEHPVGAIGVSRWSELTVELDGAAPGDAWTAEILVCRAGAPVDDACAVVPAVRDGQRVMASTEALGVVGCDGTHQDLHLRVSGLTCSPDLISPIASTLWLRDGDCDGDGAGAAGFGGTDCDDQDAELQYITWVQDHDGDGWSSDQLGYGCTLGDVAAPSEWFPSSQLQTPDCDDDDDTVNGPFAWYQDDDGDTFHGGMPQVTCFPMPGWSLSETDCNDANPAVNETVWYPDVDGDGRGDPGEAVVQCAAPTSGSWVANDARDCDDADAQPQATVNGTAPTLTLADAIVDAFATAPDGVAELCAGPGPLDQTVAPSLDGSTVELINGAWELPRHPQTRVRDVRIPWVVPGRAANVAGAGTLRLLGFDISPGPGAPPVVNGGCLLGGADVTIALEHTSLMGCSAIGDGGAILAGHVEFDGVEASSNQAGRGGAVAADTFVVSSSALFGNTATEGGAAWVRVLLGDGLSEFTDNTAFRGGGLAIQVAGDVRDVRVVDNEAGEGGGIWIEGDASFEDVTLLGNLATSGNGGGLLCDPCYGLSFEGVVVDGNTSTADGGGVAVNGAANDTTVTWVGGALSFNLATGHGGGAILTGQGLFEMSSVESTGNASGLDGGHLALRDVVVASLMNVQFQDGTAQFGGMLDLTGGSAMTLDGACSLTGGNAQGGGAAHLREAARLTGVDGARITESGAQVGGGVWLEGASTLDGSFDFSFNTAEQTGGAVHHDGALLELTDSVFLTNSAALGGAVHANAGSTRISWSMFDGNSTSNPFSGAIHYVGTSAELTDNTFVGSAPNDVFVLDQQTGLDGNDDIVCDDTSCTATP